MADASGIKRRMALRCRLGRHAWHIWCAHIAGHDSYRERRCGRCLSRGIVLIERQKRGYYGGVRGPWRRPPEYPYLIDKTQGGRDA